MMAANKRVQFLVSFELPDGASETDALKYIRYALHQGLDLLNYSDALSQLNNESVQVSIVPSRGQSSK
jgi:hypothetical protein